MLSIVGIRKTFNPGSVNERLALAGLSLHLQAGDVVTVIGGNGAGKSTLLNMVAGVHPVDEGRIIIENQAVEHLPEHIRASYIGRVFQDPMMGTAASMTIEENLAMAVRRGSTRKLRRGIRSKDRQYFCEQLELLGLGLEDRLTTRVGLLSGGQRQALTLLMATLVPPKLLLLDEHTAALDPSTAQKVLELTEKMIKKHKLTTLMVTHNMEDALRIGNRTIMMHEGRIIFDLKGEQRKNTRIPDLLEMFKKASGRSMANDRMLLAN
ncbi:ABC transporter related protein [Desulforamulus reducens MI-1]|uniref:ABC transporter related protein n=1 Tax=Desulforamulus reducens (strain ATCC BAA-1160 / DSM 100696 / MI-1) TaxID=349161 RepID=A4J4U6_DESRM|nr:ATP-binding cassette domain-containing protein [Desulforamulus reducens]ABO50099.1 ABC transporter related protein [Desulforamulus reducens MI-1]